MRITYPAGTRSNFYDRNAITRNLSYNQSLIGPHALTTRWTYTVPASKKFLVGTMYTSMFRDAGAAPGLVGKATINTQPSGGSSLPLIESNTFWAGAQTLNNAVTSSGLWLSANDAITGSTSDTSTGGSHYYNVNMAGTEYDA